MKAYYDKIRNERYSLSTLIGFISAIIVFIFGLIMRFRVTSLVFKNRTIESKLMFNENILYLFSIFMMIVSVYEAFAMFGFKLKRSSFEDMLREPTSKRDIFIGRYLSGLLETFKISIITFIVFGLVIGFNTGFIGFIFANLFYISVLTLGLIFYTFFSFILLQSNSYQDGFVLIALSIFAPYALIGGVIGFMSLFNDLYVFDFSVMNSLFMPFGFICKLYIGLFTNQLEINKVELILSIIMIVIMASSALGVIFQKSVRKAENANQVSKSPFAYKLFIPLVAISFIFIRSYENPNIYYFIGPLVIIATYLLYVLWNRTFRLRKIEFITLATLTIVELGIYLLNLFV